MNFSLIFRALAALAFGLILAGCGLVEGNSRANQPMSGLVKAQLRNMGSSERAPMLVRIFKEESTLEVWKQVGDGTYKLFKSYEICAWSGELGPKFKEGDRQSPEGFYSITPGLMNPHSNYYLAFNTGFPNKFDRAHGRTGSNLMVHGDCSSRGCYAMTDEQIAEIYILGREAFRGGQRTFELQIFPFRMTAENMARHHDNPNIEFWRNIKVGYDAFEMSHRVPKWDVCEGRYIFNPAGGPLDANGICPTESTAPQLMARVKAKQIADEKSFEVKVAAIEADEVRKAKAAAEEAERARAIAERGEAVNRAVAQRADAVGSVVGGFFSGIVSSFTGDRPAPEASPAVQATMPAPVPAPASDRPS